MMDELREQFLIESRELLADAAQHVAALARNPGATGSIEGGFRAIHTLKGSVALFAMAPAESVLHAAEDVMERARNGRDPLSGAAIRALVDSLDQVDRWIDHFEQHAALPDDAATVAERTLSALAGGQTTSAASDAEGPAPVGGAWLDALRRRHADIVDGADRPLVAFCYQPDADCFFRGEDPLASARDVPDLVTMTILPRDGHWPDPGVYEPFVCCSAIEGLSTAPLDAVRAAFRLMPDQVRFALIDRAERPVAATEETASRRTLRIDPARIDALGDTLGELFVAMHGFYALADDLERIDRSLAARARGYQANLERVTGNLQLELGAVRSVPLESGLRRLPRLVREIADSLGKPVDFAIEGQDIEVDRQVAEGLFEPLLHLVRNAIGHGIEPAEARRAAGKPPAGKLTLAFQRERDLIFATLSDDGKGIDPDMLRRTALDRALSPASELAALSDSAALRLVFLPGFSTAKAVTELSGRGVGMDAVRNAVVRLRGSIEVDSTIGVGTTFRMALPATALTTRLLVVEAGGDRYGVALDQIVETVGLDRLKLVAIGTGTACVLHGRTVPVLDLGELLGGEAGGTGADRARARDAKLIVVRSGGEPVAMRVDRFGGRIDALVRPPGGMLAMLPGVIGSTLLADGEVLLVLDLPGLAA